LLGGVNRRVVVLHPLGEVSADRSRDEVAQPMLGSTLVRDPQFQDRVVAGTRALLSRARSDAPAP
jgi:hypothetical protein